MVKGGLAIVLVPLLGHTLGHCGVAIKENDKWFLNAGDAYFYHAEMYEEPHCTPGLWAYQRMMDKDHGLRVENQSRLRSLKSSRSNEIEIFCSYDPREFEKLANRQVTNN
ncbi:MAG TPA: hypothetical protein VKZ84_06255 [Bacteriovoracaceae bacterium]|nr:hypothetical protein [Bacteriovoracaceae bacterium]